MQKYLNGIIFYAFMNEFLKKFARLKNACLFLIITIMKLKIIYF